MRTALSIAGSDPCGGAGIQADLKTFHTHGVYGLSVITAITVQNTQKVYDMQAIRPGIVYEQIMRLFEDMDIHAVKIGMVPDAPVIGAIADALGKVDCPRVILDPVMISSSGYPLLAEDARKDMVQKLFPQAFAVTPNIPEAEFLCGEKIRTRKDMEQAARKIRETGPENVVIKGGHMPGTHAGDMIWDLAWDGMEFRKAGSPKIKGKEIHGTGCVFSSSLAAHIALGRNFSEAAARSKAYMARVLGSSLLLGQGSRVMF